MQALELLSKLNKEFSLAMMFDSYFFAGYKLREGCRSLFSEKSSSTGSKSKISVSALQRITDQLAGQQNRLSTSKTYLRIWRCFNKFLLRLDRMPNLWEDRTSIFVAHLISEGRQSSSIRLYVSAIKGTLIDDRYRWDNNKFMIRSMARVCKVINDVVCTRLPIHRKLLELLLFEIQRYFLTERNQLYLSTLYSAVFALGYYGLMRAGKLMVTDTSVHTVKARDVHVAINKNKLMLILYSSKTHTIAVTPQEIKITSNREEQMESGKKLPHSNFSPFQLMRDYLRLHGDYDSDDEPFFVFRDGTPLTANQSRNVLKIMINRLSLDQRLYNMQAFRIGRASDMAKFGHSIDVIKRAGRWKSNAVFRYIRS